MTFYYIIYALVLGGVPICFIIDIAMRRMAQKLYFASILLILAVFAGVQAPGVSADYDVYTFWFKAIANGTATQKAWLRDPMFALISYLVSNLGQSLSLVMFIYAALSLIATIYFVFAVSAQRWATLLFYLIYCQY